MKNHSLNQSYTSAKMSNSQSSILQKPITYISLILLGMGVGIGGTIAFSYPHVFRQQAEAIAPSATPEVPPEWSSLPPITSENFVTDYPKTFDHLMKLSDTEEFSSVIGTYLDWYKIKIQDPN